MERDKRAIFLHEDEWNRLKSVRAIREPIVTNEYVKSMTEKSQQWINSWPDSVQGHMSKVKQRKKNQFAKDMEMIKMFKKKQQENSKQKKSIEKAKQIIFDDSCYGRKLISALLESKTLEERDAQIEFNKKLKENNQAEAQHHDRCFLQNATDMINQEKERATRQRKKEKELAQVNRTIYLTQCDDDKKEKENQKVTEYEDMRLLEELIKKEAVHEANMKLQYKEELKKFIIEQKKILDSKALREDEENQKIEIWRKYEDRKNAIMEMIHKKRFEKSQPTEIYELIKKINDNKEKSYEEFVNKGIKTHMDRLKIKDEEDKRKNINELESQYLLTQSNKKLEIAKKMNEANKNKLICDRQCIIVKCNNVSHVKPDTTFVPLTHSLVKNLEIKSNEPSPWTSTSGAHAQFARQAGHTLKECRYKRAARKVVDEYRTLHGLKSQNFPVENYF